MINDELYSTRRLANPERCCDCKRLIYYDWQLGGKIGDRFICRKCKQKEKR